jgi:hypothetical protein
MILSLTAVARSFRRISDLQPVKGDAFSLQDSRNMPAFWMNLQTRYDLEVAEDELADKVERDVQPLEVVSRR